MSLHFLSSYSIAWQCSGSSEASEDNSTEIRIANWLLGLDHILPQSGLSSISELPGIVMKMHIQSQCLSKSVRDAANSY